MHLTRDKMSCFPLEEHMSLFSKSNPFAGIRINAQMALLDVVPCIQTGAAQMQKPSSSIHKDHVVVLYLEHITEETGGFSSSDGSNPLLEAGCTYTISNR